MFVGQLERGSDLVALVPVGAVFLARSLDGGQRYKAAWLVDVQRLPYTALAVHREVAIPQVVGAAEGIALGDAPAQGVVGVASCVNELFYQLTMFSRACSALTC